MALKQAKKHILRLAIPAILLSVFSFVQTTLAGEDCSSITVLSGSTGSVSGSTSGATSNNLTGANNSSPDLIYQISVPANQRLAIGATTSYDSVTRIALASGGCTNGSAAGTTISPSDISPAQQYTSYHDDPNSTVFTYTNNTGVTQDIYWVQSGYYSANGSFTIDWSIGLYSTPSVYSPCCGIGIDQVVLDGEGNNDLNISSGTPTSVATYSYYNTIVPQLQQGTSYNIDVSGGYPTEVYSIWIDFNQDGDFVDMNELIVDNQVLSETGLTSASINVPSDASLGVARMRIAAEYGSYSIPTNGNGPNTYGEYEDYDVEIVSATIGVPTGLSITDTSTSGEVGLTWTAPTSSGSGVLEDYVILYGLRGGSCDPTDYNNADFNTGTCTTLITPHSPTNPQTATITGLTPHFQYIFAVYARNNLLEVSTSSNTVNGPDTSINSITPNSAINTSGVHTTIYGDFIFTGPTPTATIAILKRGSTTISCDNPIYTTTSIECDFNITGATVGSYSIVLTNYDNQEISAPNSFTVQAGPMTLNNITPDKGTVNGGTEITINGANFLTSYYQVPYVIGNFSEELTNFQLPITLDTQTLISAGKMNNDCSDIRFKDSNETTDLDFFLEGPCNSTTTKIWIKIPTISTTEEKTFYLQYGDFNLSSASNPNTTFVRVINNVQASWDMDETSGDNIQDTSGNGLDVTYTSGGYIYPGRLNQSRLFAPGRYVNVGNPTSLQITGPITLETWVKLTGTSNGTYPRLISKLSCYPYNGYELLIGSPDGGFLANRPYLQLSNNANLSYTVANDTISADNTWHHIVATYDPNQSPSEMAKIYFDGVPSISFNGINSPTAIADGGVDLYLGVNGCFGNYLSGYLDSTKIYNGALTAEEVSDLYNYDGYTTPLFPNHVLVRQFTTDTITVTPGAELGKGINVNIDGQPATNVYTTDNNTVFATTNAHAAGTVDIEVINSNNESATLPNSFTFYDRKLKVININNGADATVSEPFSITVGAFESDETTPYLVESNTYYTLSVVNGTGGLVQAEGMIPIGQSENTRTDYAYTVVENNITLSTVDSTQTHHFDPNHLVLNSTVSAPFNTITGPPAANPNSTLLASSANVLADGIDSSIITVNLRTSTGDPAHDKNTRLAIVGNPSLGPTINNIACGVTPGPAGDDTGISDQNGQVCFRVRSLYTGTFIFQATSETDNQIIDDLVSITFTGPTSADSTLTANKSAAAANGNSRIILTATLLNNNSDPFAGRPITINRTDAETGATTISPIECPNETSPIPGTTNVQGHACFSVTSFTAGNYTFNATNSLDNFSFPNTSVNLTFGSGLYWGNTGVPIANGVNDNSTYHDISYQQIISTSDGGNIVVWTDNRNGDTIWPEYTIYAQRFNSSGVPVWNSGTNFDINGIKVFDSGANTDPLTSGASSDIEELRAITDGANGVIITWTLDTNNYGRSQLVGQKLDDNGELQWGSNFKLIEDGIQDTQNSQYDQYDIDKDGYGGAFLTYRDFESSGFNGQYTYYDRMVTRIDPNGDVYITDGPEADGFEESWPVLVSGSSACENLWGKVVYYDRAVVRVIYDYKTFGSCTGDANRRKPLAIATLNNSDPDDELNSYFVSTNNMNSYYADEPFDTENGGGGYSTGCTSSYYAYEQTQPLMMNDDNGGVYVAFVEACEQNIFINGWDLPIFVTHIPNATSAYQMGSRQIGVCPNYYSCLNTTGFISGGTNSDRTSFFLAWYDLYDLNNYSIQKFTPTILQSNYSVPTAQWDYDINNAYPTPLPYSFTKVIPDNMDGIYIIHNYNITNGLSDNQPRLRATHLGSDGLPVGGWALNGNQISNIGNESAFVDSALQYMPYSSESLGSETSFRHSTVLADSSGNLVTTWLRTGYPIYGKTATKLFLQKMVGSTGLPAISPSEYEINQGTSIIDTPEINQSNPSVAKVGENYVYAWVDELDTINSVPQNDQIRVEKFNENGEPQWNTKNPSGRSFGIIGLDTPHNNDGYSNPQVVADYINGSPTGNTYIIAVSGTCIVRQKLNSYGQAVVANPDNPPVDICDGALNPDYIKAISDDNGGLYIFYLGYNNSIFGQHIDVSDDQTSWPSSFNENPSLGNSYLGPFDLKLMNDTLFLVYTSYDTSTLDKAIKIRSISTSGAGIGFAKFVSSTFYEYSDSPGDQSEFDVVIDPSTGSATDSIYIIYKDSYLGDGTSSIKIKKYNHNLVEQFGTPTELVSSTYTGISGQEIGRFPSFILANNKLIAAWVYGYLSGGANETSYLQTTSANTDSNSTYWSNRDITNSSNPRERNFRIVSDGIRGAFIAFDTSELALTSKVYLRHIINAIDQSNNLALSDVNDITTIIKTLVTDGSFGAIASWERSPTVNSSKDIYGNYFVEPKNAFLSSAILDLNTVPADGVSYATITATYLDDNNQPIPNRQITAEQIYGTANGTNITYIDCDTSAPATETSSNGTICIRISSSQPDLYRFAVYDSENINVVFSPVSEITFSELPVDPDNSDFTATPTNITANNIETSTLIATVRNTANLAMAGKTVTVSHNGTDINLTEVECDSGPATPGVTNSFGEACFTVSSNIGQLTTFTATVSGALPIDITNTADVRFTLLPADPNLSYASLSDQTIESVNMDYYNLNRASTYNASLLKTSIYDAYSNIITNREVNLSFSPSNLVFAQAVTCNNPRESIAQGITDQYGTACFLILSDIPQNYPEQHVTISITVDGGVGGTNVQINSQPIISVLPGANVVTAGYRFRNDDGNELTATPASPINFPYYNLNGLNPFRLRLNLSRYFSAFDNSEMKDEFSPTNQTDIGPRPLPPEEIYTNAQSFRAFPGYAINETTNILYMASADLDTDQVVLYKYDLNNLNATPNSFRLPETVNYSFPYNDNIDQPIDGATHIISNMFIDETNDLMYFVLSPYFSSSTSDQIKIYKVDLNTETIIDVLTEAFQFPNPNSTYLQDSYDAEIDLENGFMYLTVGGPISVDFSDSPSRIMKIKLNGPTSDMNYVDQLVLANSNKEIYSSVIDTANKFLYVSSLVTENGTNYPKVYKIDLNVDPSLPPVKVDEIYLNHSNLSEVPGYQSAVIDTLHGYAYFGTSDSIYGPNQPSAYINKVDIDPSRTFELIGRLNISGSSYTDSNYGAEIIYTPIGDGKTLVPSASIDLTNQYAFFPAAHLNNYRNLESGYELYWKLLRVDLENFTVSPNYDELTYSVRDTNTIKGTVFSPNKGKGYFVRHTDDGDVLTEFNSTMPWEFKIQSAKSIANGFCDYQTQIDGNYNWQDLPNSDFQLTDSANIVDGSLSTNVTGIIPDNNTYFEPGGLFDNSNTSQKINLGRNQYTEVEYSISPTSAAKGSYCFRVIDKDTNNNHQASSFPGLVLGEATAMATSNTETNAYPGINISGLIFSKNSVNIIEGTTTDSYGVKLSSQPTDDVIVSITSYDYRITLSPDDLPASPTTTELTFNTSNWNDYQYITVSAINNEVIDGTTNSQILHTTTSADLGYNNLIAQPVTSIVTDYGATSTNVTANVAGDISFAAPADFSFPAIELGTTQPNFSPNLDMTVTEDRGVNSDFTITVQTTGFCKSVGMCIPLEKVYLATANLVNPSNIFNAVEIGQFLANYLQDGNSLTDRSTYVHSNSAEDRNLLNPITIFDSRNVPSGSSENPLQGIINFSIHLMIDYQEIAAESLEPGDYITTLVFDINANP